MLPVWKYKVRLGGVQTACHAFLCISVHFSGNYRLLVTPSLIYLSFQVTTLTLKMVATQDGLWAIYCEL